MATPNRDPSQNKYSEQYMGNSSFDEDFGVNAVEALGFDDGGNVLRRVATNSSGQLEVEIVAGAGSGGTASADDADFTAGTTSGTPTMGVYESSPTSVTDGDMGIAGITATRELKVSIENDAVGIGGGTQYAVDTDLGATPTGTLSVGIRDDALSTLTPVEGDAVGLRVDSAGALWVTPRPVAGIGHGVKTVTTAGTDVVLASSTACKKVDIQAQTDNTGLIAVGASGVDATEATGTGIILYAGDTYSFEIDNLADVYIDSTVNGEGVRYTYYT